MQRRPWLRSSVPRCLATFPLCVFVLACGSSTPSSLPGRDGGVAPTADGGGVVWTPGTPLFDPQPPRLTLPGTPLGTPTGVYYDIVYARAPRHGDDDNSAWAEVFDPVRLEPGTDLMLLRPDGSEEVLVAGGPGAIVDPFVSFDAQWVFYARFHDLRPERLNTQRRSHASYDGADLYKIHLATRRIVRLTNQEWTPNTGVANWSRAATRADPAGSYYLGYGIFNLGPTPLPGGRVMFTSSRNGFAPNKDYTFPNLQLFVMDDDGRNVEQVGHLNLGSALHPTILADGRVMFSSYEAQGLRDQRLWGLWQIWPDGREWGPLMSAFAGADATAFHFQTQLSNGRIVIEEYYNLNNNGFGSFLTLPPFPRDDVPPFGSPDPDDDSNPAVQQGWYFARGETVRSQQYPFSPDGLLALTLFAYGGDSASFKDESGEWLGKVTHPSGAPHNDLLLVWSPGPANDLNRPTARPYYDGGIYLLAGSVAIDHPRALRLIKNDPRYNEMQPRAVVPYREIYGIDEPFALTTLPNDGSKHPLLPPGTPFGLVGTSSFYKRNTKPGRGVARFGGLGPFNTSENGATSNWSTQGADVSPYRDDEIHAVRIVALEPTSHLSYGPREGPAYTNHANERHRILGEIPLRKIDASGAALRDADGNPDTSFLARIPADVPFTFQTLDKDGLVLNMAQTWHQVRPGEVRTNCGGCHAHAQRGTDFATTAASRPGYEVWDLTKETPLLTKDAAGAPALVKKTGAVDVEYYRDIKPILVRSCVMCHNAAREDGALRLDDAALRDGYEGTWHRLANDSEARHGHKPVIPNGTWRQENASRYVRAFQSRRSLLIWKIFGRRLDGWRNEDHPTESVPGDRSTLPPGVSPNDADLDYTGTIMPPPGAGVPALSVDEKITFARWVDLGCPISADPSAGWFADDLRPTLTVSWPRAGATASPLDRISIGAFDYYSGLDEGSLSVTADFDVNGRAPGAELAPLFRKRGPGDPVWELTLGPPRTAGEGTLTVRVRDRAGNITEVRRTFTVR